MDTNCALPCPPLDEKALFGRTGMIDIFKFFEDIDDDENKIDKPESRRTSKQMQRVTVQVLKGKSKRQRVIQAEPNDKSKNTSNIDSNHHKPGMPKEVVVKENASIISEVGPKSSDKLSKSTLDNVDHYELKLESTTKKLRQAYKDVENKKRKIQVIDLRTDQPKSEDCRSRLAKKPRSCGAAWGMQKGKKV